MSSFFMLLDVTDRLRRQIVQNIDEKQAARTNTCVHTLLFKREASAFRDQTEWIQYRMLIDLLI